MMKISRLAPREREIAEIVCSRGEASAVDVERAISDPISNAAIRSMLRRLEAKGVLRRRRVGRKYLYAPALSDMRTRDAALHRLACEHFAGSIARMAEAAAALATAQEEDRAPLILLSWNRLRRAPAP